MPVPSSEISNLILGRYLIGTHFSFVVGMQQGMQYQREIKAQITNVANF